MQKTQQEGQSAFNTIILPADLPVSQLQVLELGVFLSQVESIFEVHQAYTTLIMAADIGKLSNANRRELLRLQSFLSSLLAAQYHDLRKQDFDKGNLQPLL